MGNLERTSIFFGKMPLEQLKITNENLGTEITDLRSKLADTEMSFTDEDRQSMKTQMEGKAMEMATLNLPLLGMFIKRFSKQHPLVPDEIDDLLQWGFLDMYNSALKYDPKKGASFATYATKGVGRNMSTRLDQLYFGDVLDSGGIWRLQLLRRARRTIQSRVRDEEVSLWEQDTLLYASMLMDAVNLKVKAEDLDWEDFDEYKQLHGTGWPKNHSKFSYLKPGKKALSMARRLRDFEQLRLSIEKISLDKALQYNLFDNTTGEYGSIEIMIDPADEINSEEEQDYGNFQGMIRNWVDNKGNLSDRERAAIVAYYYDNMTLEEVGNKMGLKRERARKILAAGMYKLKKATSIRLEREDYLRDKR